MVSISLKLKQVTMTKYYIMHIPGKVHNQNYLYLPSALSVFALVFFSVCFWLSKFPACTSYFLKACKKHIFIKVTIITATYQY